MLHTAVVSIPEISVPSPGRNKPPPRIRGGSLLIACCRRSDSGVRRQGREREKNKEEKRERGRNAFLRSHPSPTPSVVFFSSSHISLWCPTIWTPGTDYFADPRNTVLWINSELSAANSIPAFMFLRYSSILFGIAPSALITFGTTFTLSHSRSKNINSVSFMFVSHSQWFLRNAIPESLWQHRPKGSEPLGTRITFFCCCFYYYYYYYYYY